MSAAFTALGLGAALVRAVDERGHTVPTPIQALAIPAALAGRDLLAQAPTGSGKTAAYALAALQWLHAQPLTQSLQQPRCTRVLVLVPTRELAIQVGEECRTLARHLEPRVKVAAVFGGVSINPQMMALRGGAELVVATPGRLLDLLARNALGFAGLGLLVLDEADRLLQEGFADELARIAAQLPAPRQTLLFSATLGPRVLALAQALLHAPQRIEVAAPAVDAAPPIVQRAVQVDGPRRTQLLRHLIGSEDWGSVLVFVATQHAGEHVASKLAGLGLAAAALHGQRSQGARKQVLADFKAGRLRVLVATDLASRGIDIARLPVVVNYDLPRSATDHQHRIGRTGRAGHAGLALSFICADQALDEAQFRLIEKRQGLRVRREQVTGFEPALPPVAPPATGGIKGRRPSKKDRLREAAITAAPAAPGRRH